MNKLPPKETSQGIETGTQTEIAASVRANALEMVSQTGKTIAIAQDIDITIAWLTSGKMADQAGLSNTQKHCVMTSVSELAMSILHHAGAGKIEIKIIARDDGIRGVEIIASDQGKGIENIDLALQDGYSTKSGLGGSLPGTKRMMGEMEISSTPQKGTTVRAVKWEDDHFSWD